MKINFNNPVWKTAIYGIEREALRVDQQGNLALTDHPKVFGDKLENKFITTDFSESQLEMVTPTFSDVNKLYDYLGKLYDYVASKLGDELIWPFSMPCKLPDEQDIPIAKYGALGNKHTEYRQKLKEKYGGKKQLISGIHYNFSFSDEAILDLQKQMSNDDDFQEFKNKIYLKIARNYLRFGFVIVSLFGCSNIVHESYDEQTISHLQKRDSSSFILEDGISIRNSKYGYCNDKEFYPDYSSLDHYIRSVEKFVDDGLLSEPKELYAIVRLKSSKIDWEYLKKGVSYLEVRNIDINPFDKRGIDKNSLNFLHVFMLWLLQKEESDFTDWQKEGKQNLLKISESGFSDELLLKKDGQDILATDYITDIFYEVIQIANEIGTRVVLGNNGELADKMDDLLFIAEGLNKSEKYKLEIDENISFSDIASLS